MAPEATRLCDEISIMKYICKEFWNAVFNKQIDNLRTNNSVIKIKIYYFELHLCKTECCKY